RPAAWPSVVHACLLLAHWYLGARTLPTTYGVPARNVLLYVGHVKPDRKAIRASPSPTGEGHKKKSEPHAASERVASDRPRPPPNPPRKGEGRQARGRRDKKRW